ncbi:MAG: DUF2336 domain-containing protein [Xanthobacteraceae bacterium]
MSAPTSKLQALAGLIRNDGTDPKPALLRILTDFYIQKQVHTPEEDRHFSELALRLIEEVDGLTRADIARRLANHGSAPAAVLQRLTVDPESQTERTAQQPIPPNAAAPSQTTPASARTGAAEEFLEVTEQDRAAATKFSRLFFAASSDERRSILRELETGASVRPLGIAANAAAAARWELEGAALRSRPYEFVRHMERTLAIPRSVAEAIVNDGSGEPLLVVAKALNMPTDVVQRILLLVNPAIGNSVRRVFDLSKFYDELSLRAALRLVSLWRYSEPLAGAESTAHPLPDAGRERRAANKMARHMTSEPRFEFKPRDQRAS